MTAITFDTLAYVKTLRDAGIEERQAEAQVVALATVLKTHHCLIRVANTSTIRFKADCSLR
ncbi:MAG: hypothetical protein QG599_2020 [Pseudomonadota bacterium]|nr:hypothetical protein [Pseudomonadota bacterium]